MFSKNQRIDRKTIKNIIKQPDSVVRSGCFTLRFSKNNLNYPRFSIVIPKKVEKSAVKRHLLKRKITSLIKDLKLNNNFDYVLFLNNKIDNYLIKQNIDKLFNDSMIC